MEISQLIFIKEKGINCGLLNESYYMQILEHLIYIGQCANILAAMYPAI